MSTLLIELLTEELPPKALARLGEAFAQSLFDGLSSQGLLEDGASVEGFATPRRLAASISGVRISGNEICNGPRSPRVGAGPSS
jgi:glycyl-tRNA synthetase beta chain